MGIWIAIGSVVFFAIAVLVGRAIVAILDHIGRSISVDLELEPPPPSRARDDRTAFEPVLVADPHHSPRHERRRRELASPAAESAKPKAM
jgi:hypothetical protein